MKAVIAICFALALTGCATTKENPQLAAFAAKQIFYRAAMDEPERAQQLLAAADDLEYDDEKPIGAAIRERVDYDAMALADRALVDAFVAALHRRAGEVDGERRDRILAFVESMKNDLAAMD